MVGAANYSRNTTITTTSPQRLHFLVPNPKSRFQFQHNLLYFQQIINMQILCLRYLLNRTTACVSQALQACLQSDIEKVKGKIGSE